jgi:hypothetical protein
MAGVPGGVDVEDRRRAVVEGLGHGLALMGEAGAVLVDADAGVGERDPLLDVASDEPWRAAVPDPHPADRCLGRHRLQRRRRRVWAGLGPVHRELGEVGQVMVGDGHVLLRG